MIRTTLMIVLLALAGPAMAQTAFFDELGDVPVMPALSELPDRSVSFDKPEGRIAQVTALAGKGADLPDIEGFYTQSLPQFGWQAQGKNRYIREGQVLTITPQTEAGQKLVVFRLEPR